MRVVARTPTSRYSPPLANTTNNSNPTHNPKADMLRRIAFPSAAPQAAAAVCATASPLLALAARGGFQRFQPKQDIPLGKFSFNEEYSNFRQKSGRAPDQDIGKYRKMYFRLDELCRRQERYIQKQGHFFLPGLDYATYKGCQPLFTPEQLRVHFGRHHRAYVNKLNELIEGTNFLGMQLDEIIRQTDGDARYTAIFNNAGQHYNHMFFWKSIAPWGVNFPPELRGALEAQFESVEKLHQHITDKAMGFFGSGWLWLVYDTNALKFEVLLTENAKTPLTMQGKVPLLAMDLWEHTWYIDYENNKAGYVANFLKCADWHWAERHWKRGQGKEYNPMVWG